MKNLNNSYRDEINIVAVVTEKNFRNILNARKKSPILDQISICGTLEFRADTFSEKDIIPCLKELHSKLYSEEGEGKNLLFTVRLPNDGGNRQPFSSGRYKIMENALNQGIINWLDIELEQAGNIPNELKFCIKETNTRLLVSHHNFRRSYTKSGFNKLLEKMETYAPDLVKFSVMIQNENEFLDFMEFAPVLRLRFSLSCLMSMGRFGPWSRVITPLLGCPVTYGYIGDEPVVDGQLEVRELFEKIQKFKESGLLDGNISQILEYINIHDA